MIRPTVNRDKEAKLRGLASRKGVEVHKALRSGCFRLYDAKGKPVVDKDGTKALPLGDAITVLMRMPNVD